MASLAAVEQLIPSATEEIRENRRNGFGFWSFLPTPAASLTDALPDIGEYGDFLEMQTIVDKLIDSKNVLVQGAPGSGKSHLVEDVQTGCVLNNLPAFVLSVHVNAGMPDGIDRIAPHLDEFEDKVREFGGGVVVLDNIDMLGYRGKRRQRSRTAAYAQRAEPFVHELLDKSGIAVIATAHDDAWREGRWTWQDDAIDRPANAVLEAFTAATTFQGEMELSGLAHILRTRNLTREPEAPAVTHGQAAQVIRHLNELGRANFFHANHLSVLTFLDDPSEAIAAIDRGRDQRRGLA